MDNPAIFIDEVQSFTNTSTIPLNTQIDTLRSATNPTGTPLSTQIANIDNKLANITNVVTGSVSIKNNIFIIINELADLDSTHPVYFGRDVNLSKSIFILNAHQIGVEMHNGQNQSLYNPCYISQLFTNRLILSATATFSRSRKIHGNLQVIEYN